MKLSDIEDRFEKQLKRLLVLYNRVARWYLSKVFVNPDVPYASQLLLRLLIWNLTVFFVLCVFANVLLVLGMFSTHVFADSWKYSTLLMLCSLDVTALLYVLNWFQNWNTARKQKRPFYIYIITFIILKLALGAFCMHLFINSTGFDDSRFHSSIAGAALFVESFLVFMYLLRFFERVRKSSSESI